MSTPMWELPEHIYVPVDSLGNGPVDPEDRVGWACWCGDYDCEVFPKVADDQ